jgi:hypothetical protein
MPNNAEQPSIELTFEEYGRLEAERSAIFMERQYGMKRIMGTPIYYRVLAAGLDPDSVDLWVRTDFRKRVVILQNGQPPKE